jgi:hypothetical protein
MIDLLFLSLAPKPQEHLHQNNLLWACGRHALASPLFNHSDCFISKPTADLVPLLNSSALHQAA